MQLTDRTWTRRLVAIVILGGLVGAGLGFAASTLTVPGYDASAFLLVTPSGNTPVETSQVQYAQAISQVITNPTVLAAAGDDAEIPDDPEQIRADPSSNAPMIEIIVNAETANQAQRQAQTTAEAVVAYTDTRADVLGFQAVVLAPAAAGEPAGLSLVAYLVAGAAMGAVLCGVLAMLRGPRPVAAIEPWSRPSTDEIHREQPPATTAPAP
jgi:hypothetical protein